MKPTDKALCGRGASHRAVTYVHPQVASINLASEAEPSGPGEGSMGGRSLTEAAVHSGGVVGAAR